jgi:peptidyl-prolyl cis-trans isomerase SurA
MLRQLIYQGLILASFIFYFYPPTVTARLIEQVIVVIDGEPYTLSNIREHAKLKLKREFPTGELSEINQEDRVVLEQFITERLLAAEVERAGIKVTEEDVDRHIEQIKAKNQISDEQLKRALSQQGLSMESYRALMRSEIEKGEIINREVRKKVNITDKDVERYHQLNQKQYTTEERVRLQHILLPLLEKASPDGEKEAMRKANEIYRRAVSGEDFGALARSYSDGAGASEGGDIGWVKRGGLLKEIDEVAFNKLSPGEISQPVRTSLGIHIIRLTERDGGQLLPLSAVGDKIKKELYAKIAEERFQKWLKTDLRKKHRVDVKLPGVVFRPEETGEETVKSLMASSSKRRTPEEKGFLSYLNPLTYLVSETPLEEEGVEGELSDQEIVSVLGVPLFVQESNNSPESLDPTLPPEGLDLTPPPEESTGANQESKESSGFFSSVLDTINPF